MPFLDPAKPLATCSADSCQDCGVGEKIHCHFRPLDLAYFMILCLPGFLLGGKAILDQGWWWFIIWLGVLVLFFGFVEIRVMCSHCPHYAEEGFTLACWANNGMPKLWKYRPGPMSIWEKTVFLAGFAVVWGYPLVFLLMGSAWFLLLVYLLCVIALFMSLQLFLCSKCMNFACPLNRVDQAVRREFLRKNPRVQAAWEKS